MHVLRDLWAWFRNAIGLLTEQAVDMMSTTVVEADGKVVVKTPALETITRRTVAVITAGIGTALLFAPWVNARFANVVFDSTLRLAYGLWSGYEGLPD